VSSPSLNLEDVTVSEPGLGDGRGGIEDVAGLVAPAITGVLVDQTGLFDAAFALAAGVNILGLVGWLLMLPQIAPIQWIPTPRGAVAS